MSAQNQIDRKSFRLRLAILFLLVSITVLAFYGVWENLFIDYDDNNYVFLNPDVVQGISWPTVKWAATHVDACHWVPLTWLSHALDCQLFGLNAAGHHATNLVLHALNVVLLFVWLQRLTGSLWRSAFVAALFGIHPLRVESVAWVAERKDVLSGLFFMLTLLAYTRYARRPSPPARLSLADRPAYCLALCFFACGLMSKPMLVTLPCVLLLLDYWPLRRFDLSISTFRPLVREKIPFFILSALVSAITVVAQGEAQSNAGIPLAPRLANAVLACVDYLVQTIWPGQLAVFYPLRNVTLFTPAVIVGMLFLIGITAVAFRLRESRPWVTMGWLWFIGVLLPASGIVQAADVVQADRFTYLPSIGLFVALVWSLAEPVAIRPSLRIPLMASGVAILCWFRVLTHQQVAVWKDTRTLFTHAAKVTPDNHVALTFLANFELTDGRPAEASAILQRVLEFAPGFPRAEYLLASILQMRGKMSEAIPHLERSTGPEVAVPGRARLVISLLDADRYQEADAILDQLTRFAPGSADLALMKAASLRNQNQLAAAVELFRQITARQEPPLQDNPTMNFELSELYGLTGQDATAVKFYSKALDQFPQHVKTLNNFAWLLATSPDDGLRNGARAVELAERACQITEWKHPVLLGTLAAAYAEAGRFDEAVKMAERARDRARLQGVTELAQRNSVLLESYRQGRPCRESAK